MWTNFFSRIVLINLLSRPDRLVESSLELKRHKIPFEVVNGIKNENGQQGISDTLRELFAESLEFGNGPLLVFEDDVRMVVDPYEFERVMDLAILELPTNWDMLYLGANLPNPNRVTEYSAHLLRTARALALHAVAYSTGSMKYLLCLSADELPIDLQIANNIHPLGNTFVTHPLLCTQRPGYSNIENKEVSYSHYIEDRYRAVENYLGLSKTSLP